MKKLIHLSLISVCLSLGACATIAQTPLNDDISSYIAQLAESDNISTAEAKRRLFINANRDKTLSELDEEFIGRIAGHYFEHQPIYRYVIRLKGNGVDTVRQIKIYNPSNPNHYEILPVAIKYGSETIREEAQRQVTNASTLVINYFPRLQVTYYDDENDVINAEVNGKPTPKNLRLIEAIQSQWGQQHPPINVEFVNFVISPL